MLTYARKNIDKLFLIVFSSLVIILFYSLISWNGLVSGNDPAIHLERSIIFLSFGKIPLADVAWYPPMYHIVLATFMVFTGATSIEQMVFLMKCVTVLIDWLLVFSVYLLGANFFGKKVGILASALLLLCFPLYEINFWGGYTSILSIAFMTLLFAYISIDRKGLENALLIFILAFSMVLSHQLATFLGFIILPPFIIFMLAKTKGRYSKAWIGGLLGALIAFMIYYYQAIMPYFNSFVSIIFFQLKAMSYQISAVSQHAFIVSFGAVLFLGFFGIVFAFFKVKKSKNWGFYVLLLLALFVPLILSQSFNFGLLLPFGWFLYYLMPPLVVLAAVSFSFVIDVASFSFLNKTSSKWRSTFLKVVSVIAVVSLVVVMALSFQTVNGRLYDSTQYYSWSDVKGYEAATWLRNHYDNMTMVVATEKPGSWFGMYSGKYTIAETDPIVEWNYAAESILDLSTEMSNPVTMIRTFESKENVSQASYVSVDGVWRRACYVSENLTYVSFRGENNSLQTCYLSDLDKKIVSDSTNYPYTISIQYSNEKFTLTEKIQARNDSYPMTVTWNLAARQSDLHYVIFSVTNSFDASFSFDTAYIPSVLNWQNPWYNASRTSGDNGWAITDFSSENLIYPNNNIGICDNMHNVEVALSFQEKPYSGNIGALRNRNIDALRFQYQLYQITTNQSFSATYQTMAFSQTSFTQKQQPDDLAILFQSKTQPSFKLECRNYIDFASRYQVGFMVIDSTKFDTSLLRSELLQLVFTNNEFVILKIKGYQGFSSSSY